VKQLAAGKFRQKVRLRAVMAVLHPINITKNAKSTDKMVSPNNSEIITKGWIQQLAKQQSPTHCLASSRVKHFVIPARWDTQLGGIGAGDGAYTPMGRRHRWLLLFFIGRIPLLIEKGGRAFRYKSSPRRI
jgi:hypothetical protein